MLIATIKNKLESMKPVDIEIGIAYAHKLPVISVQWEREKNGKAIVGTIRTSDEKEFSTYAYNAAEFIEMVNDAVSSAYNIPINYREKFFHDFYQPKPEDLKKLFEGEDGRSISFEKDYGTFKTT